MAGSSLECPKHDETASKPLYAPTRAFYAATGFTLQAMLPDFYAPGDGKQIWLRVAPSKPVLAAGRRSTPVGLYDDARQAAGCAGRPGDTRSYPSMRRGAAIRERKRAIRRALG